jgi:hypothetical protein
MLYRAKVLRELASDAHDSILDMLMPEEVCEPEPVPPAKTLAETERRELEEWAEHQEKIRQQERDRWITKK